jgi:hypothetical protein
MRLTISSHRMVKPSVSSQRGRSASRASRRFLVAISSGVDRRVKVDPFHCCRKLGRFCLTEDNNPEVEELLNIWGSDVGGRVELRPSPTRQSCLNSLDVEYILQRDPGASQRLLRSRLIVVTTRHWDGLRDAIDVLKGHCLETATINLATLWTRISALMGSSTLP